MSIGRPGDPEEIPESKFAFSERLLFWALMTFVAALGLTYLRAYDLGLHLVVGDYIVHHGLPETNVFSPVNMDHPLVLHEWGFQVLSYGVVALGGMDGLAWFRAIIVVALGVILHGTLRPGKGYVAAVACVALGVFVANQRFEWRPELLSMLFLAVEYKLLIDFVEERRDRLLFLPVLFVIWSNFHGYFLAGLIVGGCFAVGELIEAAIRGEHSERGMRLIRIGLLCIAATVLNPYHIEGALYPFVLLINLFTVDNQFNSMIMELWPPSTFPSLWAVKAWYPLLIVFVVASLVQGKKVRFAYLLAAFAIWVMARSTFRNIGLYGITFGVLSAVQWQSFLASRTLPLRFARIAKSSGYIVIIILLCMSGFIATNRLYKIEGSNRIFGVGVAPPLNPPAREFIGENIPVEAQVFNSFNLGSRYLWWFYPARLPFIDGNGDGYSPEFFTEYWSVTNGHGRFAPFARRYDLNWVYLGLETGLARRLYRNPDWHPVYLASDGIILVNQAPVFSKLRAKIDLRADLARGQIPNWVPTRLPTLLNQTVPRGERILEKFLLQIGEPRARSVVLTHARRFVDQADSM